MQHRVLPKSISRPRRLPTSLAFALVFASVSGWVGAQEPGTQLEGKAIAEHPAGKAILEASRLLKNGELGRVQMMSSRDVRDEWIALSDEYKQEDAEAARLSAPDPETFARDLESRGVMTFYADAAELSVPSEDGAGVALGILRLEDGIWRVTAGPKFIDFGPGENSEPQFRGAEILDHEIGKLLLSYGAALAVDVDSAMFLATEEAQAERLSLSPEEREESDRYRRSMFSDMGDLIHLIQESGALYVHSGTAYFNGYTTTSTPGDDGTVNFTSSSVGIGLALEDGAWKIAN
ncbi:MAG: hypothetical protein K8J08_15630 [Thermoanaerobaculia bacterium]|nr:hypothetical protein [Thermoanaerobaculia bacterium]